MAVALLTLAPPAVARDAAGRVAWVTDGDTFGLEPGERVRIAGVDAPETQPGQAKCRAEVALGLVAKRQASALLQGRMVAVERVGRSYGRTVARVRLDGRDVGAELVRIGAARWWPRGVIKPGWCSVARR